METVTMPFAALIANKLPYTASMLNSLVLFAVSGTLYAVAVDVWMVVLAQALTGTAVTCGSVVLHMYMGEMGTVMDSIRERKGKKPRKFIIYILYSLVYSCASIGAIVLNVIMAQFTNVNPYRWPGWFLTAWAVIHSIAIIFCFTETHSIIHGKQHINCSSINFSCVTNLKLSKKLNSNWKMRFLSYLFLIACAYMVGQTYGPVSNLAAPVLSDHFGFTVKYTSYFLSALSIASACTFIIQVGKKFARVDNRLLLGLFLLMALVGSIIFGDWQSISHDPCLFDSNSSNQTASYQLNLTSGSMKSNLSDDLSLSEQLLEDCESRSSSNHHCFWNPQSRITGEFCNTCYQICQSIENSQNIYQFSIGTLLTALAAPLGKVLVSAIISDITSVGSQGIYLSIFLGTGSFSRVVSTFWFIESYTLTGRHTYFAMAICAATALTLLISLAVLYTHLAPRPSHILVEEIRVTNENLPLEDLVEDTLTGNIAKSRENLSSFPPEAETS